MKVALIIFMKFPEPGKVKTRLGAEIGLERAADFYRAFVDMTFDLAHKSQIRQVFVAFEPTEKAGAIQAIIPGTFGSFAQSGADLGERLIHAFQTVFAAGSDAAIAIGTDSPTLPPAYLANAAARLAAKDLVLGPATDGGYYLVGLRQLHSELFKNVAWSSESVLPATVAKAESLGLQYELLPEWYDVDDLAALHLAARDDASSRLQALLNQSPGAGEFP